jgi:rhamnulose-1-phosphate aldolase
MRINMNHKTNSVGNIGILQQLCDMCDDGVALGWHERNAGNVSYRMKEEEYRQFEPFLREEYGAWTPIGVTEEILAGEHIMITGSGKYLKNVRKAPADNVCIIEINDKGDAYRIVWGLEKGGRPTSELPTHFMGHATIKRKSEGRDRVIYHAHTPYTIALSHILPLDTNAFSKFLWLSECECCAVFPDGVGILPWTLPGGVEIAEASCRLLEKHEAIFWAFHGMFASGPDFDYTFGLCHMIEKASMVGSIALSSAPGMQMRQKMTEENLQELAASLNVKLNQDVLNYKFTEEPFIHF